MLVLIVGTLALLVTWLTSSTPANPVGYSQFLNDVGAGKVSSVVQQQTTLTVKRTDGTTYTVTVPSVLTQVYPNDMVAAAKAGGITTSTRRSSRPRRPPTRPGWGSW